MTLEKDSPMIAIKRLSMIIMLIIVHRMKRIHTYGTAIAPKLDVSKSPRIIL